MDETVRRRIGALQPLLRDERPEVRSAAAEAIERLEGISTLDEILLSLKKGDRGTRIKALYSLGVIGGERVLPPLVYCARRPEDDIRSVAVEVLGSLALPSALPVLLERLDDRVEAIQARAIAALGNFAPTPELYERLRPFLEADDGSREAAAALALARLGDQSSGERIEALLASAHPSTRQAAATALSLLPVNAQRS
jgi:HEAT repeat protein